MSCRASRVGQWNKSVGGTPRDHKWEFVSKPTRTLGLPHALRHTTACTIDSISVTDATGWMTDPYNFTC